MKKILVASMMLASMGANAQVDYTQQTNWNSAENFVTNLSIIYGNIDAGSWGDPDSMAGATATAGLIGYLDSITPGSMTAGTVMYDGDMGFVWDAPTAVDTVTLDPTRLDTEITAVVTGVSNDLFGTATLNGDLITTDTTTGNISYTHSTALVATKFNDAVTGFNGLVNGINDGTYATAAAINTEIANASASFNSGIAFVNDAVEAVSGIGVGFRATTVRALYEGGTNGVVDGFQLPRTTDGYIEIPGNADGHVYCTYQDYVTYNSQAASACSGS